MKRTQGAAVSSAASVTSERELASRLTTAQTPGILLATCVCREAVTFPIDSNSSETSRPDAEYGNCKVVLSSNEREMVPPSGAEPFRYAPPLPPYDTFAPQITIVDLDGFDVTCTGREGQAVVRPRVGQKAHVPLVTTTCAVHRYRFSPPATRGWRRVLESPHVDGTHGGHWQS